jgi:uncharacterized protein YndB with AHSA1/START domain
MLSADAVLQDDRGRTVLRFERTLEHPAERVWRYLTEPAELSSWHPSPFELQAAPDGQVRRVRYSSGAAPGMENGEVTDFDPPRLLGYTWGEDHLRWELHPRDGGCLLVLVHTFDDHFKAARDAAGWHLCLDALAALVSGAGPARDAGTDGDGLPADWKRLNREYEDRFGIPPEKATPPPTR